MKVYKPKYDNIHDMIIKLGSIEEHVFFYIIS